MSPDEIRRVEAYLRRKLHPELRAIERERAEDSVEIYLGAEFLAVVYKDVDEGETAYQFQMTILSEDLPG